MLKNKNYKKWITKVKVGTILKSSGPIAIQIADINTFGQVELKCVMDQNTYIEKKIEDEKK